MADIFDRDGEESCIVVTGCASGLGKAIAEELHSLEEPIVVGIDQKSVTLPWPMYTCDVTNNVDLFKVSAEITDAWGPVNAVVNCAGINMIKPFDQLSEWDFDKVMNTNVKSILFTSQAFLGDLIQTKGTIINVVSNASHMPMTHSFAYNASKGAAEIATRQMARELTKAYGITVFGISPNKLAGTGMSNYIDNTFPPMRGMTYEEGREYQLKGLLTGKETNPAAIAELVCFLLERKERHEYLSGCILQLGL